MNTNTTTNTTTTEKARAALVRIMRDANRAARRECQIAAAEPVPQKISYRATMSAALAQAWEAARAAELPAPEAWAAMSGADQWEALIRMSYWLKWRDGALPIGKTGRFYPCVLKWATNAGDVENVAAGAYVELVRLLETPKASELRLKAILFQAVFTVAQRDMRETRRNASALKHGTAGGEYETALDFVVNNAAPVAEPIAPSPENALIIRDTIARAAVDETDKAIIKGLAAQYTRREIGDAVGMSHTAVNKRVKAIRERYDAADTESAAQEVQRLLSEIDTAELAAELQKLLK